MIKYNMQPVPVGKVKDWSASILDESGVRQIKLQNPKIAMSVHYGMRPEGYDGVVVREERGGSVIIPYTVDESGQLYVGVIKESRPTMGGFVWNLPRGAADAADKDLKLAALREMEEETGIKTNLDRIRQLSSNVNPNSALMDTSTGNGVSFFALEFRPVELVKDDGSYRFPDDTGLIKGGSVGEKITECLFMKVDEVIKVEDMFTLAGVGLLLTALRGRIDA